MSDDRKVAARLTLAQANEATRLAFDAADRAQYATDVARVVQLARQLVALADKHAGATAIVVRVTPSDELQTGSIFCALASQILETLVGNMTGACKHADECATCALVRDGKTDIING